MFFNKKKELTICANCKYAERETNGDVHYWADCQHPQLERPVVGKHRVTGKPIYKFDSYDKYPNCNEINTDYNCRYYEKNND